MANFMKTHKYFMDCIDATSAAPPRYESSVLFCVSSLFASLST